MAWNEVFLIDEQKTVDRYGDQVVVPVRRSVYAEVRSVGMQEFYQGMAVGYKPEVKFRMENYLDYHGEALLAYTPFASTEEVQLKILRTYRDGDALELTCYKGVEEE